MVPCPHITERSQHQRSEQGQNYGIWWCHHIKRLHTINLFSLMLIMKMVRMKVMKRMLVMLFSESNISVWVRLAMTITMIPRRPVRSQLYKSNTKSVQYPLLYLFLNVRCTSSYFFIPLWSRSMTTHIGNLELLIHLRFVIKWGGWPVGLS